MTSRVLFTLALLALTCVLIVQSLFLSPLSRVAPLWVLVPTAVLLAVRLALDLSPEPGKVVLGAMYGSDPVDGFEEEARGRFDARAVGGPDWKHRESERRRELRVAGWLVGFVALVYLLGLFIAMPAFLLVFLRWEARLDIPMAAALTLVVVGILFLMFGVVADLSFPEGWILRRID